MSRGAGARAAAAAWAAAFGAASLYAAAGGRVGSGLVAPALVEAFDRRDPMMVATLWAVGILKLVAALVVLAAGRLPTGRVRRLAGAALAAVGVGLAGWGVAEGGAGLLVATGLHAPLDGWGDGSVAVYYAAVWGPVFLLGGVLFVLAGRELTRSGPRRRAPRGSAAARAASGASSRCRGRPARRCS